MTTFLSVYIITNGYHKWNLMYLIDYFLLIILFSLLFTLIILILIIIIINMDSVVMFTGRKRCSFVITHVWCNTWLSLLLHRIKNRCIIVCIECYRLSRVWWAAHVLLRWCKGQWCYYTAAWMRRLRRCVRDCCIDITLMVVYINITINCWCRFICVLLHF